MSISRGLGALVGVDATLLADELPTAGLPFAARLAEDFDAAAFSGDFLVLAITGCRWLRAWLLTACFFLVSAVGASDLFDASVTLVGEGSVNALSGLDSAFSGDPAGAAIEMIVAGPGDVAALEPCAGV
jgi:hypothetical protein